MQVYWIWLKIKIWEITTLFSLNIMKEPTPYERYSYNVLGTLRLHDVRYDPNDIAYCNPLPDGRVQIRVQTEHAITEGRFIYNDGDVVTLELVHLDDCSRWRYWEVVFKPNNKYLGYSFHFMTIQFAFLYKSYLINYQWLLYKHWMMTFKLISTITMVLFSTGANRDDRLTYTHDKSTKQMLTLGFMHPYT